MTYYFEHDVFISYKREELWTPWVRDHFKSLLRCYLQQDLGRPPDIFVDERIEIGADWVKELGAHLALSRVVVAVFSGDYFWSDWCIHELDLTLERCSAVFPHDPARLIIPTVVHDGELIPPPVTRIQAADIKKYRIACINRDTPDYHEFSKAIRELSPHVKAAIELAPPLDDKWVSHHQQRFDQVYNALLGKKRVKPSKFKLPHVKPMVRPPRLRP